MEIGSIALSYAAGALSTLSPCVLPLLPVLLTSAVQSHALGPLALALGLSTSFVATGLLVGALGMLAGVETGNVRMAGAISMVALGIVLLVPAFTEAFARRASLLTGGAGRWLGRVPAEGAGGQLLLGLVLGIVWTPCIGPTLGAAVGLAAQSETIAIAGALMLAFSIGAATPLLALAYGSRQAVLSRRERLSRVGSAAKPMMGAALAAVGLAVLTGLDKIIETALTDAMPAWLLELTTRY